MGLIFADAIDELIEDLSKRAEGLSLESRHDEAQVLRELAVPWLCREVAHHRVAAAGQAFMEAAHPSSGIVGPDALITMTGLAATSIPTGATSPGRSARPRRTRGLRADTNTRPHPRNTKRVPRSSRYPFMRKVCVRGGTGTVTPCHPHHMCRWVRLPAGFEPAKDGLGAVSTLDVLTSLYPLRAEVVPALCP
ncbi:MAG: hypothetical protein JWL97_3529 [Gemmatimonadales bacterium]|jgi:hypothetical protein|nr:hypothetical protein [Gemmatimonadales bacterium]